LLGIPQTIYGLSHVQLWDSSTGQSKGEYEGVDGLFTADGRSWLMMGRDGVLRMRDTATGKELAALKTDWTGDLHLAGGGSLLMMGTRLLDLTTWTLYTIPGNYYGGSEQAVSQDGSMLIFTFSSGVMIFGVPDAQRPAWQPIKAKITVSGVTLRTGSDYWSKVLGTAKGAVLVSGRDDWGEALYLPDLKGWIWRDYVDLGGTSILSLPIVCSGRDCR
jgi:hypothetical protein